MRADMRDFLNTPVGAPVFSPSTACLVHGPFLMWLTRRIEPRRIIALGARSEFAYFAACQGVHEAGLNSTAMLVQSRSLTNGPSGVTQAFNAPNLPYRHFSALREGREDLGASLAGADPVDLLIIGPEAMRTADTPDLEHWQSALSSRAVIVVQQSDSVDAAALQALTESAAPHPVARLRTGGGLTLVANGPDLPDGARPVFQSGPQQSELVAFFDASGAAYAAQVVADRFRHPSEQDALDLAELTANAALLERRLREARKRPLKQLGRKIRHRFAPRPDAGALDSAQDAAARLDPARRDIPNPLSNIFSHRAYGAVLRQWELQRAAPPPALTPAQAGIRVTILCACRDLSVSGLADLCASLGKQSHDNWRLWLTGSKDLSPQARTALDDAMAKDPRIMSEASPQGADDTVDLARIAAATDCQFIAVVTPYHRLDRDALREVVRCAEQAPDARIIYSDDDSIGPCGTRQAPHFKPDWNRELFYSWNYLHGFVALHAELAPQVGALPCDGLGAETYDLVLRAVGCVEDGQIRHIPRVLCTLGGAVATPANTPRAHEAGRQALEQHLAARHGRSIAVGDGPLPFTYRPDWRTDAAPMVSIMIPTRDHLDVLRLTVTSILERTTYRAFEIIIIDNGSTDPATLAWMTQIESTYEAVRILRDDSPFNYSALNNKGAQMARGEILALVNNDIEVITPDWLDEMVSLVLREDVGCVGAKLLYPDDTVQHAGVIGGIGGVAGHGHKGYPRHHPGYFGRLKLRQEYRISTAACLVVRREIYEAVGGLNAETLAVAFNDVDFCLKVHAAGYRNLWTPFAELYHHESVSRGADDDRKKRKRFKGEADYMIATWALDQHVDPAYSRHLSNSFEDFRFGPPAW